MSFLSSTYSVEQFLDDNEKSVRKLAISAINNQNLFCLDFYKIAGNQVFSDLEQAFVRIRKEIGLLSSSIDEIINILFKK